MGLFKYEDFEYNTVINTKKGRNEKYKKYKDTYVKDNKTYIEVYYSYSGIINRIYSYIDGKKNDYNDMPAVLKFTEDGKVYYEAHYQNGLFHSINGPAIIERNEYNSFRITDEIYMRNGKYHRLDGPAIMQYHLGSGNTTEKYYMNGTLHRIGDLPAITIKTQDGILKSEVYYKNGKQHRDGDYPAVIKRFQNGVLQKEVYSKNGKKHRANGKPALLTYRKNGQLKRATYYINGRIDNSRKIYSVEYYSKNIIKKQSILLDDIYSYTVKFEKNGNVRKIICLKEGKKHNAFGPAEIEYNDNGDIIKEIYYLNGKNYEDMEFMIISGLEYAENETDVFSNIIFKKEE